MALSEERAEICWNLLQNKLSIQKKKANIQFFTMVSTKNPPTMQEHWPLRIAMVGIKKKKNLHTNGNNLFSKVIPALTIYLFIQTCGPIAQGPLQLGREYSSWDAQYSSLNSRLPFTSSGFRWESLLPRASPLRVTRKVVHNPHWGKKDILGIKER